MRLRKLLTPYWLAFTVLVVVVAAACLAAGWWQWTRYEAVGGTFQNLGYTFMWPVFAGFAVYLWWRLLTDAVIADAPESVPAGRRQPQTPQVELPYDPATRSVDHVVDDESDPELAAYNRYLAALNAQASASKPQAPTAS